ncbi:MAG: imidazole glycerol phosphate synthase subunit HisH [Acidobacteria bacterium]|jgi:glutamine amidotransferase|nr:MAG: imidazole glycerol phosphate synthase subunit HisH [Acidobacteriota bacterium]GIU83099.1 MAG: imidazole glycerol phosphate synthase subunit HisH [Pyrinomonadaceae bacterium]
MKVVVVKYNAGNTESVKNALKRLGVEPILSDDAETISTADKVIFPGVGEASSAMRYLRERHLDRAIKQLKQPLLGICLGMQLLCSYSEENNTDCLHVFPYAVRKFEKDELKVPHIGWNNIFDLKGPLFKSIAENSFVYFVHSYYVETGEDAAASSEYGIRFSAALERENFYAVQFHPEKSGEIGEIILKNFLSL